MGQSPSILFGDQVTIAIINAVDTAQYGEYFDPIETELLLTSQRLDIPILTDQVELIARIIESASPVQVFDIDDFDFAMDDEQPLDQV